MLFFFSTSIFAQEESKDYSEATHLIEVWFDAQIDYDNLPGITASIVSDQELIWAGAYGMANIDENIKAEVKTLCSICSISKLFTSVAIMELYDEGKLRLDDKINDVLPWYDLEQQYSDSGPITIRSLLSHSSGLPRENTFSHWSGPNYSFPNKAQIQAKLSTQKTLYPSSTYYQYSNLAFTLLGYVVEEVSGESFEDYIEKNILSQLELQNTSPTMPVSLHGTDLAVGYSVLSRNGTRKKMNSFQANGVAAAAGFSSNVEDLAKFASWQFRLRDSKLTEILKPSSLKNMHNVHWTDPNWGATRGLGFGVWKGSDGNKWVGHDGYCPGYQTVLQLNLKNKLAYSVMINANGVDLNKYVNGMHTLINKVKPFKKDATKEKNLEQYIGYYEWDMSNESYVSPWQGNLAIIELPTDSPSNSMRIFKHIDGDNFRSIRDDGSLGEALEFERNNKGEIYRYKLFNNWLYVKVER